MPELIKQEHVYAAIPPLYKIIYKNKNLYIKDDIELQTFKKNHKGINLENNIQRFKGFDRNLALIPFATSLVG